MLLVIYTYSYEDDDINVYAHVDGQKVGHAWGLRDDDRLQLADIEVEEKVVVPQQPRTGLLALLLGRWPTPKFTNYRRQGIGRELLRRFLAAADEQGVAEVWGDVTHDGIAKWPGLLDWYKRHGFTVTEPDTESIATAAKKVTRRR